MTRQQWDALGVGDKVWFKGERLGYTVQARSGRYLVCTKPFNPRHTVLYTVVDLDEWVRGTENLVFGMGAETREQCEEMIRRLEGTPEESIELPDGHVIRIPPHRSMVSRRNRVPLRVRRFAAALTALGHMGED